MLLKIFALLLAAAVAAAGGHYIMKFFLARNAALLRAYKLEPGRVCHPLTLFLGMAVMLLLGAALPQSVAGKLLSCVLLCWLWLLWLIDWRYQFIFDDMVLPLAVLCLGAGLHTGCPVAACADGNSYLCGISGPGYFGAGSLRRR